MTREEWVAEHFDRCAPWLEEALQAHPLKTHTIEHVRAACTVGDCQLWPTKNSATVVQIVEYPTGIKIMHFWLCGGSLRELRKTERNVEAYAREHGFTALMLTALRSGWERALPGYVAVSRELVKDLREDVQR